MLSRVVDRLTDHKSEDFAHKVGDLFETLPHLPKGVVEFFVKIAPIAVLIGAVLSLFASPILGIASIVSLLSLNPLIFISVVLAAVFSIASAVILFLAFKPLQARSFQGWMLLFWSDMLSFAQVALGILLGRSSIFSLIGTAIAFYILFEMRPWYGFKGKIEHAKSKAKEIVGE